MLKCSSRLELGRISEGRLSLVIRDALPVDNLVHACLGVDQIQQFGGNYLAELLVYRFACFNEGC